MAFCHERCALHGMCLGAQVPDHDLSAVGACDYQVVVELVEGAGSDRGLAGEHVLGPGLEGE